MIDMVVSGKSKFDNADAFLVEAIKYIDEKIYPGEGIKEDLATRISKILANNQSLLIDTEEDDTYGEESFNNFD